MSRAEFEKQVPVNVLFTDPKVLSKHTPYWMRPKNPFNLNQICQSAAMKRMDSLSKKKSTLRYFSKFNSPETAEDLQDNFDSIEDHHPPTTELQEFSFDP